MSEEKRGRGRPVGSGAAATLTRKLPNIRISEEAMEYLETVAGEEDRTVPAVIRGLITAAMKIKR